ncbi:S9 family peptidase [Candidatus Pantoea edessiphila]|uniref:Oligopeptidase B n=1 Tax=Candidatus Pantoea edessiphila TaxID=2044610 RepID=A0A2P5SWR9_9GAMM|nr:prolyl oligopeptidase family serine peptidase [Candidatus Pantoea edessiphila]PPI86761.1 oligopeptidase B [Candidatus Pantoea edessiphila]
MKEPFAKQIPHKRILHGTEYIDYYHWLRDDQRNDTEVIKYLQLENDYTRYIMKSQNSLKNLIFKEIIDRLPLCEYSIPHLNGIYLYQSRYEHDKEYPKYYRRLCTEGEDKWTLILDTNVRALSTSFYSIGSLKISPDNCIIAIAEDFLSRFQYNIQFFDIKNNFWYSEKLYNAYPSIVWDGNSKAIFYVKNHQQTLRNYQIWYHKLGTQQTVDKLVYEEKDDSYSLNLYKTTSKKFILIYISSTVSTEVRMIDMDFPDKTPEIFVYRRFNHMYSIDHYNDIFIICSNRDKDNFALYYTEKNTQECNWKITINGNDGAIIENFQLFRDWIVIEERKNGLTKLYQISWQDKNIKKNITLNFNDPIYKVWLECNSTPFNNILRYGYSSMTTPDIIFELNMDNGNQCILKKTIINNFNPEKYKSEYHLITVRDGTKVPLSLVYNRKYRKLNENPVLIYGYGAYGNSVESDFCISRLSLLDRGFIYIIVHVRGGGEFGQKWHDSGRLLNKMNSFTDFIDVTNYLINFNIGNSNKLYAMGGSAGGLLIGTVINLSPKLFHGVVLQVPFVDIINTMLDKFIPLTTNEYEEWGNPEQFNYYRYMKKYSPYDNIKSKDYPNIFITSGYYDSQVQYWEQAKWVAKLRKFKTDKNLLLLYTDMCSGHLGKSGRYKKYKDIALELTFIIALAYDNLPNLAF